MPNTNNTNNTNNTATNNTAVQASLFPTVSIASLYYAVIVVINERRHLNYGSVPCRLAANVINDVGIDEVIRIVSDEQELDKLPVTQRTNLQFGVSHLPHNKSLKQHLSDFVAHYKEPRVVRHNV